MSYCNAQDSDESTDGDESCDYCGGGCPHDTAMQCAMSWYDHYMAIEPLHLAAQVALDDDPSMAMSAAFEKRREEIGKAVVNG